MVVAGARFRRHKSVLGEPAALLGPSDDLAVDVAVDFERVSAQAASNGERYAHIFDSFSIEPAILDKSTICQ